MSTLEDAAAFATDERLILPLTAAIVHAAVDIMAEDGATVSHAERAALAYQVLQNPAALVGRFAWAVTTNATVSAEWAADNLSAAFDDLAFTVSSVWNAEAGITA